MIKLAVLQSKQYQDVLSLQKTMTLVDARNLADDRYTSHETFNQQIAIADTVVANKLDLYDEADKKSIGEYIKQYGKSDVDLIFAEQGKIAFEQLHGEIIVENATLHHHHDVSKTIIADMDIPECGYLKALNNGQGYQSIGWRFLPTKMFNYQMLFEFLNSLQVRRMKAVFNTDLVLRLVSL